MSPPPFLSFTPWSLLSFWQISQVPHVFFPLLLDKAVFEPGGNSRSPRGEKHAIVCFGKKKLRRLLTFPALCTSDVFFQRGVELPPPPRRGRPTFTLRMNTSGVLPCRSAKFSTCSRAPPSGPSPSLPPSPLPQDARAKPALRPAPQKSLSAGASRSRRPRCRLSLSPPPSHVFPVCGAVPGRGLCCGVPMPAAATSCR